MIIVKLKGGLGNQMFQYAAGRYLAVARNTSLKLDISLLCATSTGCTPRHYGLDIFDIHEDFAEEEDIKLLGCGGEVPRSILNRFFRKYVLSQPVQAVFKERFFHFDPDVLCLPENICLLGYWQSERYFADIKDMIRTEFRVKIPLEGLNQGLAEQICETESVSIHVRRGDYVSNHVTAAYHPACGIEYYHRAVNYISEYCKKLHFYIFSDDPAWVESNLHIPYPATLVKHNGHCAYDDLRLMSLCRHNIIANSSFSWWGAWLNRNQDKIVVAPRLWFSDPAINTSDLIPVGWIRI